MEVDICRLPHALHIPLKRLERRDAESLKVLGEAIREGSRGAGKGVCPHLCDMQTGQRLPESREDLAVLGRRGLS